MSATDGRGVAPARHVQRYLVWVCAGCERCQEPSTDGVTPGAPIPHDSPCTDTSPSMNGMVVVAAEDYDEASEMIVTCCVEIARLRRALTSVMNVGDRAAVLTAQEALEQRGATP